jgi:hypothetical protein
MVPWGVHGGQTIRVMYPDGSGRQVDAKVPMGMTAGSKFLVKVDFKPQQKTKKNVKLHPPQTPAARVPLDSPSSNCWSKSNRQQNHHKTNNPLAARPIPGSSNDLIPFSQCLDKIDPMELPQQPRQQNNPPKYHSPKPRRDKVRLLRVTVPPNVKAGSTIHVKIPGEDGVIATQIPPNCTEFHVQYKPKPVDPPPAQVSSTHSSNHWKKSPRRQRRQQREPPPPPPPQQQEPQRKTRSNNNARLLRVTVPPNATVGSTIHIEIPGEKGRYIAAQIPPNCREFHVQYQPNPEPTKPPPEAPITQPPEPSNTQCPSWPLMHLTFQPSSTVSSGHSE